MLLICPIAPAVGGEPPGRLAKGERELGFVMGAGFAHEWGGVGDRQFLMVGGRWGRILTGPVGPGFLHGNFGVAVDILPVFLMFQETTVYGVSSTLLFRQYTSPDKRLRPFFSFGSGFLVASRPIPPEGNAVKFTPQAGLGVAWFERPGLAYLLEYRYHHTSNAGLSLPNPGINSSTIHFGVSWFRN